MAYRVIIFTVLATAIKAGPVGHPVSSAYGPAISYSSVAGPVPHIHHPAPAVPYIGAPSYQRIIAPYPYAAPVASVAPHHHHAIPVARAQIAEPYATPQYDFGYSISDPVTGDVKEQQESRLGDQVRGRYSFIEADGTRRIVEYTADDVNGFNAVVHREPAGVAPTVARVAAPIASAPVISAPIAAYPYSHGHIGAGPTIGYSSYH